VIRRLDPADPVWNYRHSEFQRLGFAGDHATILADYADVDLHEAERLIRAGCTPGIAYDLLRPE
jgi:hypothetical protein